MKTTTFRGPDGAGRPGPAARTPAEHGDGERDAGSRGPAHPPVQRAARLIHGSPRHITQRRRMEQAGGAVAQRMDGIEEEEELQMKPASAEPSASRAEGSSGGLPGSLQAGIESLSGVDASDVRVHRNSDRPGEVGALAFAQGSEIHLARGEERHLPHEAWHVVQQRQGRVRPTLDLAGTPVNDDPGLEREADRMGALAARHRPGEPG